MSAWDAVAARYDRQLGLEDTALQTLLRLAQVGPDDDLLDAGTGTGAVLRALAQTGVRPRTVLGTDPSEQMLAQVPPLPVGWRTARSAPSRLPAPDGSADVVTCAYVLHVLDDAARVALLADVARVLRPVGRLVVTTIWLPPRATRAAFALAARAAPAALGGLRPLDPRAALTAAGFTVEAAAQTRRGYPSLTLRARGPVRDDASAPASDRRPPEGAGPAGGTSSPGGRSAGRP